MLNHLAGEKSPYLLQHAGNPVDWYPWGPEAWSKARNENRPVFLSIGYSTCHWCHVMAHESFEDAEVARRLNRDYVAIKVDREERPDVDQIYMAACQALTGQGGWPLSAFLTPEGQPFYVGTYFPRTSRHGRPGFLELVAMLAEKWRSDETVVVRAAAELTQALQNPAPAAPAADLPGQDLIDSAVRRMAESFDPHWGGFGRAPKFPMPHYLGLLMRWERRRPDPANREMVELTLNAMRLGGLYDQLGSGFHRYSVDDEWLVPHFEKMLYDQALLTMAYIEAWSATGQELYRQTALDVLAYVRRELTAPEGGFFAAQDADSDGREGTFYVWRPDEIVATLGPDRGDRFCQAHGVTEEGNFDEGFSVLAPRRPLAPLAREANLSLEEFEGQLSEDRARLFALREKRTRPGLDDKVITAWNGLMIAAAARVGATLEDENATAMARQSADFVLARLRDADGRLLRRYRGGQAGLPACLDDYAYLVWGLIELHQAGFELQYLEAALDLTTTMLDLFADRESSGLFFTSRDGEPLIARLKEVYDGALPSGNSVAAINLIRLARLTGRADFEDRAGEILQAFALQAGQYPLGHTHFLMAADLAIGPGRELVICADRAAPETRAMITMARQGFRPETVLHLKTLGPMDERLAALAPFTAAMRMIDGRPTLYLCQGQTCQQPLTNPDRIAAALAAAPA